MSVQILHIGWIQYLLIYFFYGSFLVAVLFWIFQWHIRVYAYNHAHIPIYARCSEHLEEFSLPSRLQLRENYTVLNNISPNSCSHLVNWLRLYLYCQRPVVSKYCCFCFEKNVFFCLKISVHLSVFQCKLWLYTGLIYGYNHWNNFKIDVADTWRQKRAQNANLYNKLDDHSK